MFSIGVNSSDCGSDRKFSSFGSTDKCMMFLQIIKGFDGVIMTESIDGIDCYFIDFTKTIGM